MSVHISGHLASLWPGFGTGTRLGIGSLNVHKCCQLLDDVSRWFTPVFSTSIVCKRSILLTEFLAEWQQADTYLQYPSQIPTHYL